MPTYVDGFVIPIPKKNLPAYIKMAKKACKIWKDHGALDYVETVIEDKRVAKGMGLGFVKMAKLKPTEPWCSRTSSTSRASTATK